jgi:hypothetical protein
MEGRANEDENIDTRSPRDDGTSSLTAQTEFNKKSISSGAVFISQEKREAKQPSIGSQNIYYLFSYLISVFA